MHVYAKLGLVYLGLVSGLFAQTQILAFASGEDRFGYMPSHPGDYSQTENIEPGESGIVSYKVFGANLARNPDVSYPLDPWDTPAFSGGYILHVQNDGNSGFGANNFPLVRGSATTRGGIDISMNSLINVSHSGTMIGTALGALVTPQSISAEGEFRSVVFQNDLGYSNDTTTSIRGVVFDGTQWLVTAEAATFTGNHEHHVIVDTRAGWRVLDTTDYTYGEDVVSLSGAVTYAGVWFMSSEQRPAPNFSFSFQLSDAYFTPRGGFAGYTADYQGGGDINLAELLRVIELYNTRYESTRTGRYKGSASSVDGFTGDADSAADRLAAYPAYHASDTDRDGYLSLAELLRVIEIYNTRNGTMRTGSYRLDPSTPDGVAPDPGEES